MLQDTLLLSGHMCSRCRPAQTGGRGRCRSLLRPTGSARAPQPPLLRLPQRPQPRQSPARREGPAPAGPAPTYSCGAFSAAGSWGRPGLRSCAGPGTTAAPRPPKRPTLCPDPRHGPARPGPGRSRLSSGCGCGSLCRHGGLAGVWRSPGRCRRGKEGERELCQAGQRSHTRTACAQLRDSARERTRTRVGIAAGAAPTRRLRSWLCRVVPLRHDLHV